MRSPRFALNALVARQRDSRSALRARRGVQRAAILTGLLILGLAVAWSWSDYGAAMRQTKVEVTNLSRSLAEHTHDALQEADTILIGLQERVRTEGTGASNAARLNTLLAARTAALPMIHGLLVIGPDDAPLAASAPLSPCCRSWAAAAEFQRAATSSTRQPIFMGPVRSVFDGRWVVTMSRRLENSHGGFAGVAVAFISLDYFQTFYNTFDIGRTGSITLATTPGILIARRPFAEANVGRDMSSNEAFQRLLRSGMNVSFSYTASIDGVRRIGGSHQVDGFPLLVVVARGMAEALTDWRQQTLCVLLFLGCIEAAIFWTAARQMRQLDQSAQAQSQLQAGHARLLRSEAMLAESIRWLQLAEQIGGVGHWRISLPDMTLTWSDEVFRMMGLPVSDQAPDLATAIACYHSDDRETVRDAVAETLAEGTPLDFSHRIVQPDGSVRFLMSRGLLQHDETGQAVSLFGVCLDRTDQQQQEVRLRRDKMAVDELNVRLERLARRDGLTGIFNRRHFDEMLDIEYRRGTRTAAHLALVMIDVDHFKAYNDTYGHPQGDHCLQTIAITVETMLKRPADLAARYGGEELAVLLPDCDMGGVLGLAVRIVEAVAALRLPHVGAPGGLVTVSAGAWSVIPNTMATAREALLMEADRALYRAKCAGRGRAMLGAEGERTTIEVTPL